MWLVVGVTTENPVTRGAWKRVVVVVALPEENFVIITQDSVLREMASHNPMSCAALPVTESPAPRPNSVWSHRSRSST